MAKERSIGVRHPHGVGVMFRSTGLSETGEQFQKDLREW
jgi:hypothetical protein